MAVELASATPARFGKAVVFACDGNYYRQACFAAAQIAERAPDRDFDICITALGEDLPRVPSLDRHGLRICRVQTGDIFRGLFLDRRRTEAVYLRLALPRAFAGQYRRLLYLDSDVFVQGGDFSRLLEVDLRGAAIGAVRDNVQWRTPSTKPDPFTRTGLGNAPYFNSGALLIDVAAFESLETLERCIAFGRANAHRLDGHDQHLLNCVLHGDWAELSPVWNWQFTWATSFFAAAADPHVVHFIGRTKPWNHTEGRLPLRFRRAYRAFFAEHFAGAAPVGGDGLPPHKNRAQLRRSLLKHLLSVDKLCRYLDRFADDFTAVDPRAAAGERRRFSLARR